LTVKHHDLAFPSPPLPSPTKMLVLYETAMGYCLFKVSDSAKIGSADLYKEFENPEQANKLYAANFREKYYLKT
jgi:hypothetical protein